MSPSQAFEPDFWRYVASGLPLPYERSWAERAEIAEVRRELEEGARDVS